jgi:GNAT superfamily N-acetyltransferase
MTTPIQIVSRRPGDCHDSEIKDFMALVLAGGEVSPKGLEERVRSAVSLVFLTIGCCLCGVGALKRPEPSYRTSVSSGSDIALSEDTFPYEFGWVFIMPSARGRGLSVDLTREALKTVGAKGVFATSRTDNVSMHATLKKFGLLPAGRPWASTRGQYQLQLFIRRAAPNAGSD